MKKLLSLISAVGIIAGGGGCSAACSCTNSGVKVYDFSESVVNKIRRAMKNTTLEIEGNDDALSNASNEVIKKAIDAQLVAENPGMLTNYLAYITYIGHLIPGHQVRITANIKYGSAKTSKTLYVKQDLTDQQYANYLASKITRKSLTIASGSLKLTDRTQDISNALLGKNEALTPYGIALIKYTSAGDLVVGSPVQVKATITINEGSAEVNLNVTVAQSDQDKADAIASKIFNKELNIGVGSSILSDRAVDINNALKAQNLTLTNDDVLKIKYTSDGALTPGTPKTVTAIITVGNGTTKVDLKVTLEQSEQQKVDAIVAKITQKSLTITSGSLKLTDRAQDISNALRAENVGLTADDITKVTYTSSSDLKAGSAVPVVATVTIGAGQTQINLNVTVALSDQQKAEAIKDKITDKDLTIPEGTDPDSSVSKSIIDTALKNDNPELSDEDLAKITYSGLLKAGTTQPITATITEGTGVTTVTLNVTLPQTNQQKAQAIANKIIVYDLDIAAGKKDVSDRSDDISTALRAANQNNTNAMLPLTESDTNFISYRTENNIPLVAGSATPVKATITIGQSTVGFDLNVTVAQSDQEKADAIKDKIATVALEVPAGTPTDTSNTTTKAAIDTKLKTANTKLSDDDIAKITYTGVLQPGIATNIQAKIKINDDEALVILSVTLLQTDQEKADAIKDSIKNTTITVPSGTNPDASDSTTKVAIDDALKAENPHLSDTVLAKITYSGTLEAGKTVTVVATISERGATATKNLQVILAQTDQQKADAIKDKITVLDISLPAGTNPDTANPATKTLIDNALKAANTTLSDDDIGKIKYNGTLEAGKAVPITGTITIGNDTALVTLNVTLLQTDQDKADAVRDKITTTSLFLASGTNVSVANPDTSRSIKTALKSTNQSLTDADFANMAFSGADLIPGTAGDVTATITIGAKTSTKQLQVTIAKADNADQKNKAAKDKITEYHLTVYGPDGNLNKY